MMLRKFIQSKMDSVPHNINKYDPRWLKTFLKKDNFNTLRRKMSWKARTKTKLKYYNS